MNSSAALALGVLVCGASCGVMNRPDAGPSVGGGLAGAGGGFAAAGGGSSGLGGGVAGGAPRDGGSNCTQIPVINIDSMMAAGSASLDNPNDGGTVITYTGVVTNQAPFAAIDAYLSNETPAIPLMLPIVGTFESIEQAATVYPSSLVGLDCDMRGSQCQQLFFGVRGSYSISAAGIGASGMFNGSFTNVRLVQIDPMTFRPIVDGGCVDLAGFNFQTNWP
jgi:hypothetical protein